MIDAIDELVARSKDHPELRKFHAFHRRNPGVLDFLVEEIQLRIDHGFESFSFHSLWDYCRWKLELKKGPGDAFAMNDHLAPFYARAIVLLHPDSTGERSFADALLMKFSERILRPYPNTGKAADSGSFGRMARP